MESEYRFTSKKIIRMSSSSSATITVEKDLPKARFWGIMDICQWEGLWLEHRLVQAAMTFRSTFQARNDDVLLASPLKTGTTWLKSICLTIMHNPNSEDLLTAETPHFHVPTIETMTYSTKPPKFDIYNASSSRLVHTHLPHAVLPDSLKTSPCKIIYIARNPKDTLISVWHFFNSILGPIQGPFPLEKAVECFCSGVYLYGSFFDHVVEYWVESKKRPDKILFIKYEEVQSDPKGHVTKIADFLGRPLGEGSVDEIIERCSLNRLKNLEVNKSGSISFLVPNSSYFRKGEVGDWKNYLTPQMENRIDQTSRIKLEPFGLFL